LTSDQQALALERQALTATTFVELVDTLVDDFDVIELLTVLTSRSVELLQVQAAGILLADGGGQLRVMAASSEEIQLLELFQLQNDEGPCLDCFTSGQVVSAPDLNSEGRWPSFAAVSVGAGFPSVCAVPLRLREAVFGCLNLFKADRAALSPPEIALAQALADVASIAIVQDQATREAAARESRLQHALDSRVAIEQAKGMIAERYRLDMDGAFSRLRHFARNHNQGLTDVAVALVNGSVTLDAITEDASKST
jgi:GAF domain-containing protein